MHLIHHSPMVCSFNCSYWLLMVLIGWIDLIVCFLFLLCFELCPFQFLLLVACCFFLFCDGQPDEKPNRNTEQHRTGVVDDDRQQQQQHASAERSNNQSQHSNETTRNRSRSMIVVKTQGEREPLGKQVPLACCIHHVNTRTTATTEALRTPAHDTMLTSLNWKTSRWQTHRFCWFVGVEL